MAFEFWVFSPSLVSPIQCHRAVQPQQQSIGLREGETKTEKKPTTQWHGCMIVGKLFSLYLLCSPLPYNGVRDTNLIGYGEDPKKSNT